MKTAIGWLMLAIPFLILFSIAGVRHDWFVPLAILAGFSLAFVWIWVAVGLITDE